jgi:hypothetical protein
MNAAIAKKPKASRPRRPVYFRVEKLVRPGTGEEVGALVPLTQWDQRAMRDRKYHVGSELRGELKKRRNVKFHKMAHALGALIVDHVEGYETEDTHGALKRMQRECGTCCEEIEIDLGPLGKVKAQQARSIAFDEMEQGEFQKLVLDVCAHIRKVCNGVPESELSEIIASIEDGHA